MPEAKLCPQCGAPLEVDAADAPCPACLMQLGLESWENRQSIAATVDSPDGRSSRVFQAPAPAVLSRLLPQFEILGLIGQGGMGAVYKARQKSLDRLVAIKILNPDAAADAGFAERFTREAKALARLNHPHIVSVIDFGETSGKELYYFVMEYVEGTNLRQLLESGELRAEQALAIIPQVCEALQFAHDQGVIHRDIKPENILIELRRGKRNVAEQGAAPLSSPSVRVKIADFGLAKLLDQAATLDQSLTGTHQVMGTPRYMAPEQMEGSRAVDHRADIYSLGVVFYEMLTGELPLGRFAPPSRKAAIDARLDEIVLRALEKEVSQRYQQASEVKTDIESVSAREIGVTPETTPHYGLIAQGAIMLTLGLALLLAAGTLPGSIVFLWIGIGLALGGGGLLSVAWLEGSRLPAGTRPSTAMIVQGCVMITVGVILLIYVARSGYIWAGSPFVWVGIGLTLGGGGCISAAWGGKLHESTDDESTDDEWPSSVGELAQDFTPPVREPKPAVLAKQLPDLEAVQRQVRGPATALILVGIFDLVPFVLALLAAPMFMVVHTDTRTAVASRAAEAAFVGTAILAQAEPPELLGQEGPPIQSRAPIWVVLMGILALVAVPISVLLILVGAKMRKLELYGLAVVGSIVAALPCHLGWLIGFPVGIWSLFVLAKPEVKAAFQR